MIKFSMKIQICGCILKFISSHQPLLFNWSTKYKQHVFDLQYRGISGLSVVTSCYISKAVRKLPFWSTSVSSIYYLGKVGVFGSPSGSSLIEPVLPSVLLHFVHAECKPVTKSRDAQKKCWDVKGDLEGGKRVVKQIGAKNLIVGKIRFCWWFNSGYLIGKTRPFDLRTEFIIWMHFVPCSSSWLTSAVSTIVVFAMSVRGPAASRTKPARGGPRKAPAPLMQVSTPKAEVRRESSSISTLAEGLWQYFVDSRCLLDLPTWRRWLQARPTERCQTWHRRLCTTRSRSRRSSRRDKLLPKRGPRRSWRVRPLLDDPSQLQKQFCLQCWRNQSRRWAVLIAPLIAPSAGWSGQRQC